MVVLELVDGALVEVDAEIVDCELVEPALVEEPPVVDVEVEVARTVVELTVLLGVEACVLVF